MCEVRLVEHTERSVGAYAFNVNVCCLCPHVGDQQGFAFAVRPAQTADSSGVAAVQLQQRVTAGAMQRHHGVKNRENSLL